MLQVGKVIHYKTHLHAFRLSPAARSLDRGWGEIQADHIEAIFCQVDRLSAHTAAQGDCPSWRDAPVYCQLDHILDHGSSPEDPVDWHEGKAVKKFVNPFFHVDISLC